MSLNLIIGPLCILLGMFIALYVKDKARAVAKQEFVDNIKAALATFQSELLSKLDSIYSRVPELKLMLEHRDDRIDILDERVCELEKDVEKLKIVKSESRS